MKTNEAGRTQAVRLPYSASRPLCRPLLSNSVDPDPAELSLARQLACLFQHSLSLPLSLEGRLLRLAQPQTALVRTPERRRKQAVEDERCPDEDGETESLEDGGRELEVFPSDR